MAICTNGDINHNMQEPKTTINLEWVFEQLRELVGRGFYGKVVVPFQNGKVGNITIEETIKPPIEKFGKN